MFVDRIRKKGEQVWITAIFRKVRNLMLLCKSRLMDIFREEGSVVIGSITLMAMIALIFPGLSGSE